ncbi:MAG: nickel pincer cofactor biosynthesis protein LarC [Bacteroidales bacterium]
MEKRILYFDCFSGISGDMAIGAMLDLGIDEQVFRAQMEKIHLNEFELEIKKGQKLGITGTDFSVILQEHDHHHHDHHDHHHHSRNLSAINHIIDSSELSEKVKQMSKTIFLLVAEAEAKIHGKTIDEVHFHEVGAVDSIVDIIGAAVCIELLNVDEIRSSPLNLGGGFVKCAHGVFPVPAPATMEILKNVPVYSKNAMKELTTPTGAAILKAVCAEFGELPAFIVEKIGYGLGKRNLETPNVLRVMIAREQRSENFVMLETNIDNMNPEIYTHLFSKILESGALDVFVTPIIMKKNRPANKLSVLCKAESVAAVETIIFEETTTLGIRKYTVEREELNRTFEKVQTKYGEITVKLAYRHGELLKYAPEFEECRLIAVEKGLPVSTIYNEVMSKAANQFNRT